MMRRYLSLTPFSLLAMIAAVPVISAAQTTQRTVDAAQFLGEGFMQSPLHSVAPQATPDGYMLSYTIETPQGAMTVIGTEQTKMRIQEIQAINALTERSTGGAILGSAKNRVTNLVETPYRFGKEVVNRAGDISNVEDAVLFVPVQAFQAAGNVLNGVEELAVTGVRITKGAAGTKCSGFDCINKAGSDIWSGVNSIAGKHNASNRLHAEFGTDPQTENKAYRKQVDRLAYADAYTGTAIKLGAGQAGIQFVSPAFTGVGYYNNAEFLGVYEDAHRQKNREKKALAAWGAEASAIEGFYANAAFTKLYRRRLFKALNAIPDKAFAARLLHDAADTLERYRAESQLATYEYIAALAAKGEVATYVNTAQAPLITARNGTLILPVYADYLGWTPEIGAALQNLSESAPQSAIHILGYASPEVIRNAKELGVKVVQWPGRAL